MALSAWRRWWRGKSAVQSRPRARRRPAPLGVRQFETRLTPSLTSLASFLAPDGAAPTAALVMDSSGNLYGVAPQGGAYGDGTVFEVAHGSDTLTALASFNGTNGAGLSASGPELPNECLLSGVRSALSLGAPRRPAQAEPGHHATRTTDAQQMPGRGFHG
jgi:uncharacterized repeat protein (TIGR03803 family)